jgi:hypothetical protein
MSCRCKHLSEAIQSAAAQADELRGLFIKRLTVDSQCRDRRKRGFNQSLFHPQNGLPHWNRIDLDMVMDAYDNAVKDYRRTFCDTESCRKGWRT